MERKLWNFGQKNDVLEGDFKGRFFTMTWNGHHKSERSTRKLRRSRILRRNKFQTNKRKTNED